MLKNKMPRKSSIRFLVPWIILMNSTLKLYIMTLNPPMLCLIVVSSKYLILDYVNLWIVTSKLLNSLPKELAPIGISHLNVFRKIPILLSILPIKLMFGQSESYFFNCCMESAHSVTESRRSAFCDRTSF